MPPKDDMNAMDGTLYFVNESGESKPLCKVSEIETADITPDTDCEDLVPGLFSMQPEYHFGFSLGNAPQRDIKLCKLILVNNYRRLHGLRPVRHKVQKHKPEISLFAVKRMRGGFEFK